MKKTYYTFLLLLIFIHFGIAQERPEIPHIDSIQLSHQQPHQNSQDVFWYDDFDGPRKNYGESQGELDAAQLFGSDGQSMLSHYEQLNSVGWAQSEA